MFLLDLTETLGGVGSIIVSLILLVLVFKIFKGVFKFIGSLIVLGLIALAVCFFLGLI